MSPGAQWQAPLWGAGRGFALEHPGRWGGLVDLPAGGATSSLAQALVDALACTDAEDQTAWRGGRRLAARLAPATAPDSVPGDLRVRQDATYLVTGGFGGLGLLVGRWLAERGARHVALLGRHPDLDSDGVRAIAALGAHVYPLGADVADEAAMAAALRRLATEAPPLRGVVHAAANLGSAPIAELGPGAVAAMLAPKLQGTVVLERLTRDAPLDFFALFSSTTALLGASGLAHYAAANAFLDGFAQAARGGRTRVLSVNWGTWEAMRLASAEDQRRYRASGLEPMPAAEALDALSRLLAGDAAQATVARVDWAVLKSLHETRRPRPFLSRLGAASPEACARAPAPAAAPLVAERLANEPPSRHPDILLDFVRAEVRGVLGLEDGSRLSPDAGLFDLGMDSLMSVELRRRLERGVGRALPSTLTFNYPSASALATFLERELRGEGGRAATRPAPSPTTLEDGEDELSGLSDAELEARLLARLERLT
jgi:NAD(P)-dependent dehydrogenase (short-subunit alcohol dehydrogenase family)/acyl carrier protein